MNYYDGLGVREALRRRYPRYSGKRDADMLRSEHIPFNMLAPLKGRPELTKHILEAGLGLELVEPYKIEIEWAPEPADNYLGDRTSFDCYIQGVGAGGEAVGVGIEVKYTEREYRIGASEAERVHDPKSTYWTTTRESGLFVGGGCDRLAYDDLRQIWRNHLLGLAMFQRGDVDDFVSITLCSAGNEHFAVALGAYQEQLVDEARVNVRGCTFEDYIECLQGGNEVEAWRQYLSDRYLIREPYGNNGPSGDAGKLTG